MPRVLRMPEVSADATEAVLAEWMVTERGAFAAADTIATVETEKALVDVDAEDAGVVLKALVPAGAQVAVGAPIAVLGAPGEEVADLDALLVELGVAVAVDHVVPERRDVPESSGGRVFASPLARKRAKDVGLGIEDIDGTGPRNRVLRRDVERAIASLVEPVEPVGPVEPVETARVPPAEPRPSLVETAAARSLIEPFETARHSPAQEPPVEVPHTRLRRAIASRLVESKQTAPHFYLRASIRADRLAALRSEINDAGGARVSLNDMVLKAVAAAHLAVPEMNVVWGPDAVARHREVDVAVAVATDRGLITPVVRDVPSLTVTALARQVRELAERARSGKLKQDELDGGTISVTNLGMYGVEEFAAIINPPHAAILAVGAVREEPVVEDGALVVAKVLRVTLSVDHRPVDGVVAARWLAALVDLLEKPVTILA